MDKDFRGQWEKRWHPLREEWIVYAAHRNSRPWQGAGKLVSKPITAYDPACYLCPGNKRVSGKINPDYTDVFIFDNDHPVVGMEAPAISYTSPFAFAKKEKAGGRSSVICYDPRHQVSLAEMKPEGVRKVFHAFQQVTQNGLSDPLIQSVFIFENKGEAVGVSNPHPHCQVYATDFVFSNIERQIRISNDYFVQNGRTIFSDIISHELNEEVRMVARNDFAVAFIPFFARYAYEIMIFPTQRHATLTTMSKQELNGLSDVFHQVVRQLDMNSQMSFPYVMTVMQAPVDQGQYQNFHLYLWLQPPYRQPGLIKYLAGPEIGGGNFMADTMPEDKAAELRSIDVKNYDREL